MGWKGPEDRAMESRLKIEHHIDHENMLIVTSVEGDATDDGFISAIMQYQEEIKGRPEFSGHNEIVDFRYLTHIKLSSSGLSQMARISKKTDIDGLNTKLAFVVASPLAFGLGRMYRAFRTLSPNSKEVDVFYNKDEALEWLGLKQ